MFTDRQCLFLGSTKYSALLFEVWLKGHMSTGCHGITSLLSGNRDSSTVVYKSDGRGRVLNKSQYLVRR